jgi:integrase
VWLTAVANSPRRRTSPERGAFSAKPAPSRRKFKVPRPPKPVPPAPAPPSTPEQKRARKDTANRIFAILRAALNLAVARRLFRGDRVWMEVRLYENTKSARMRFLSITDQVRIVRACPPDFQRLVKGALYTGARYGELTHMNVSEYNREAQTIFIPGHFAKSGKARHIFLTLEGVRCFEGITAGRQSTEPMFVRDGEVKRASQGSGQGWMAGDQKGRMEAASKSAGLARLTFHELRHTAASTWIAAGLDLIIVAKQLGHADTRMVEQHYGHLCPTAAAARFRSIAPELGLEGSEQVVNLLIKTS